MISVIVPVHNAVRYVDEALRSVLAQTHGDWELVVVDDDSTDGSAAVLERYRDRARIVHGRFGSASAARNRGMDESRGDLIAFLDADDVWMPYKLEVQQRVLQRLGESVGFVFTDFSRYRDGVVLDRSYILRYFDVFRRHDLGFRDIFGPPVELASLGVDVGPQPEPPLVYHGNVYRAFCLGNMVVTGTVMFRRSALDGKRFDPTIPLMEDYELVARVAKAFDAAYVALPTQLYRQHEDQLTGGRHREAMLLAGLRITESVWGADAEFRAAHRRLVDAAIAARHWALGHFYLKRGALDSAAFHLRASIRRNPGQTRVYASWVAAVMCRRLIGLVTRNTGE